MFKILIVDDDDIIRKGLQTMLEDFNLPVYCYLEADNGLKALDMINEHSPDIIITDIKMPYMNGIEFIKRLHESAYEAKIIVLSGYGEFEYARAVMKYGAVSYLLKPVIREELQSTMIKVVEDLKERGNKENKGDYCQVLNNTLFRINEDILLDALLNRKENIFVEAIDKNLSSNSSSYLWVFYGISDTSGYLYQRDKNVLKLVSNKLKSIYTQCLIIGYHNHEIMCACLVDEKCDEAFNIKTLEELGVSTKLREITFSWGVSDISFNTKEIFYLIKQAKTSVREKILYGKGKVYSIRQILERERKTTYQLPDIPKIISMLESGNSNTLREYIDEIMDEYVLISRVICKKIEDILCNTLLQVFSHFKGEEHSADFLKNDISEYIRRINQCGSLEDLKNITVDTLICSCFPHENSEGMTVRRKSVQYAKNFIHENYFKNLSLDMVSNQISMNPSYFSVLFKKIEGISLIDYINNFRIYKSLDFLKDPQYRIFEISTKVGFNDEYYFSRVFKKKLDMSPSQYREKNTM